jgi:hypothetical protein
MASGHGEPVHVPAPSIPGRDQGADDLTVTLGHQKSGRRIFDQTLNVIQAIGGTRVLAPLLLPQVQDRLRIRISAATYGDSFAGQVGSVTNQRLRARLSQAVLGDDPRMTRRGGLIASGIAMVILLFAMSPDENRMTDTSGPGMVVFELSGGQHQANEILAEWGEDGQDAAREQLWIDFGFLLAYGSFLTFALMTALDLARKRGWPRLAAIGGVVVFFGALGASCDALENICLLLTLGGAGAAFPLLATIFASCKFILLIGAICYLIAVVATRLVRGTAAVPAS